VGEKIALMVHFCPPATVVPQLLVSLNAPEALMLLMLKAASPAFASVTVWAELF
jgi:hypothetical protein